MYPFWIQILFSLKKSGIILDEKQKPNHKVAVELI